MHSYTIGKLLGVGTFVLIYLGVMIWSRIPGKGRPRRLRHDPEGWVDVVLVRNGELVLVKVQFEIYWTAYISVFRELDHGRWMKFDWPPDIPKRRFILDEVFSPN